MLFKCIKVILCIYPLILFIEIAAFRQYNKDRKTATGKKIHEKELNYGTEKILKMV